MKIAIYGGSFNPPHLGHAAAIRAVQSAAEPDVLLVIPAAIPPHKKLSENSPEAVERLTMAALAFGKMPGVEVSDLELNREELHGGHGARAFGVQSGRGAELCGRHRHAVFL